MSKGACSKVEMCQIDSGILMHYYNLVALPNPEVRWWGPSTVHIHLEFIPESNGFFLKISKVKVLPILCSRIFYVCVECKGVK